MIAGHSLLPNKLEIVLKNLRLVKSIFKLSLNSLFASTKSSRFQINCKLTYKILGVNEILFNQIRKQLSLGYLSKYNILLELLT